MRAHGRLVATIRGGLALGALALAGCVPGAYVYDDAPATYYSGYYGGGGAYYPPPPYYYGAPGYYGYAPRPPRVVYVDHDHRGDDCQHDGHRCDQGHDGRDRHDRDGDRNEDRHDRAPPPGPRVTPPPDRAPPSDRPPQRDPCARGKCGPAVTPANPPDNRGMRALRVRDHDDPRPSPETRKEPD